jgi:hypothetical protein
MLMRGAAAETLKTPLEDLAHHSGSSASSSNAALYGGGDGGTWSARSFVDGARRRGLLLRVCNAHAKCERLAALPESLHAFLKTARDAAYNLARTCLAAVAASLDALTAVPCSDDLSLLRRGAVGASLLKIECVAGPMLDASATLSALESVGSARCESVPLAPALDHDPAARLLLAVVAPAADGQQLVAAGGGDSFTVERHQLLLVAGRGLAKATGGRLAPPHNPWALQVPGLVGAVASFALLDRRALEEHTAAALGAAAGCVTPPAAPAGVRPSTSAAAAEAAAADDGGADAPSARAKAAAVAATEDDEQDDEQEDEDEEQQPKQQQQQAKRPQQPRAKAAVSFVHHGDASLNARVQAWSDSKIGRALDEYVARARLDRDAVLLLDCWAEPVPPDERVGDFLARGDGSVYVQPCAGGAGGAGGGDDGGSGDAAAAAGGSGRDDATAAAATASGAARRRASNGGSDDGAPPPAKRKAEDAAQNERRPSQSTEPSRAAAKASPAAPAAAAAAAEAAAERIAFRLQAPDGRTWTVAMRPRQAFRRVRPIAAERINGGAASRGKPLPGLSLRGRVLGDDDTAEGVGLREGDVVMVTPGR